jgi:hypothetical protein
MRRTALRVAGAAIIASTAVTFVARGSVQSTNPMAFTLVAASTPGVTFDVEPTDMLGYSGDLTDGNSDVGSYRATCVQLGETGDARLSCNIVLSFTHDASTLIAEGLVNRPAPNQGLFQATPPQDHPFRKLVVTGGTADYRLKQGSVGLAGGGELKVVLDDTFSPPS